MTFRSLTVACFFSLLSFALAGCGSSEDGSAAPALDAGVVADVVGDSPVDQGHESGGEGGTVDADAVVELTILHTSDEHGWLEEHPSPDSSMTLGGVANVLKWWTEQEGYDPTTHLLVSSGDSWTGPAISTWFQGEPAVDAFNLMGYDAAAIGNHEFDFGRDELFARQAQAQYPLLSANIRYAATGAPVEFATPYVVVPVLGVQVGIIGLTTTGTSTSGNPLHVSDLSFAAYREVLEAEVPKARSEGAEIVIVLAHECAQILTSAATFLPVQVDVMFGGHCHEASEQMVGETLVVSSGWAWEDYTRVVLRYDTQADRIESREAENVIVGYPAGGANPVDPDPALTALVEQWKQRTDQALSQEIGYTQGGIALASWTQANWVSDAMLWAFPAADVAVHNYGGLRQSIPPGSFTLGDIVGMMPFDNSIVEVEVTGAQLADNLRSAVGRCLPGTGCYPAVGGIRYVENAGNVTISFLDGRTFDPGATYRVLISDFMYAGGDGYFFHTFDPTPEMTAVASRQPVVDYTVQLGTSATNPIDGLLDSAPRDQ